MKFFTADFLDFFRELEANNNREWFEANKKRFKKNVETPFVDFIGRMIDRFQEVRPAFMLAPKDAVFRIYRDIRFSADKTPYKTHMSALVAPGGRKGMHNEGAYIEISAQHARLYGGMYMPDTNQLRNLRENIAANADTFDKLLKDKKFEKYFDGKIHGEQNKRLPAELAEAAQKQPLLFNKSFYFFHTLPAGEILEDDLDQKMMDAYLAGRPMGEFLANASQ